MSGDGRGRAADEISTPARAGEFRKPTICGAPRGIASRGWKSARVRNGGALPGKSLLVCGPGRALAQRSEPIRRRDGEKGRRRTSGKSFSCQKTGRLEGRPVFRQFWRRESPAVRRRGGGIVQDAQETAVAGPVLHAFPKPVPRPRFAGFWASLLLKAPRRCPAVAALCPARRGPPSRKDMAARWRGAENGTSGRTLWGREKDSRRAAWRVFFHLTSMLPF